MPYIGIYANKPSDAEGLTSRTTPNGIYASEYTTKKQMLAECIRLNDETAKETQWYLVYLGKEAPSTRKARPIPTPLTGHAEHL